ncbi:siderophore-interacting protein [Dermabacter jinjuensis]|uniref:Siderophore-interacting protein n=1 Tax=Dermabacter jinjuensis TaxID=1667168 RepID=A0ABN5DPX1_9MICO|nr:siderophore-interacting protein [Dermabacter jinjuensis]ATH97395.1 siderophore-interacting protein [Dermabacter jinjuensis]UEB89586.1 siderophore-interacting protein [Dermabacter jinjuensis]
MTTIRRRIRELTQQTMRPVSANAEITSIHSIAPSYTRVTLASAGLADYKPTLPADGIKIAVPGKNGAPEMRAMTVSRRLAPETIEIDVLTHTSGILLPWLAQARPGDHVDVYAVRREWALGDEVIEHILIADASALPAAATILHAIPEANRVHAWLHIPESDDSVLIPTHPGLQLHLRTGNGWTPTELCDELDKTLPTIPLKTGVQTWLAAEASTVAEARRCLIRHGQDRDHLFAAAYWKHGQDSTTRDEYIRHAFSETMTRDLDLTDPDTRAETEMLADDIDAKPKAAPAS